MTALSQTTMNQLEGTIKELTSPAKGILAADESIGTITKRFSDLNIPNSEENRRNYREMLLTTPGIEQYISGVILYEETLNQQTSQGLAFSELLTKQGIIPGIKVDMGLAPLSRTSDENVTQGLDGLFERLQDYKKQGARFTKWRAVYTISDSTPSCLAIQINAETLARYAAICQEVGLVPIVEPEVLINGNHSLEDCFKATEQAFHAVFRALHTHKVLLEGIILKPSMVIPGKNCPTQVSVNEIANATLTVLRRTVPCAVPSINFLSGGQTPEQATQHLNAMHELAGTLPWNLSFSYARALQEPSMKVWQGKSENVKIAQQAFLQRAKLNSLACQGKYQHDFELA